MATLRLKELRSDYLYEFAWSNAIDTWFSIDSTSDGQYIELPVDGTNRIVVRVTSNQAEFGATAYLIQKGVFNPVIPGTLWQDYKYIQLNVADGSGTFSCNYTEYHSIAFCFSYILIDRPQNYSQCFLKSL